jgi:hypothetical protein
MGVQGGTSRQAALNRAYVECARLNAEEDAWEAAE